MFFILYRTYSLHVIKIEHWGIGLAHHVFTVLFLYEAAHHYRYLNIALLLIILPHLLSLW